MGITLDKIPRRGGHLEALEEFLHALRPDFRRNLVDVGHKVQIFDTRKMVENI
jgi:hypothetical protein